MSDETTLLPCPFCGGEATVQRIGKSGYYYVACNTAYCCDFGKFDTEAEAIAAWNTRTTHGTLTAEQVRKAVMSADRWEKPMGNTGLTNTHLIIRDDGWQAIADELNAELGSGTCELEQLSALDVTLNMLDSIEWGACSECGCAAPMDAKFCNECGKAVTR